MPSASIAGAGRSPLRPCFQALSRGEEEGALLRYASAVAGEKLAQAARFAESEGLFATPPPVAHRRMACMAYFAPLRKRMEIPAMSFDARGVEQLLAQYAPVALTAGAWIAPLAGTATVHRRCYALLVRHHADSGAREIAGAYRALLALQNGESSDVADDVFGHRGSLLDMAFLPALLGLAIARFPERLFPELLGLLLGRALRLLPYRSLLARACRPVPGGESHGVPFLAPEAGGDGGLGSIWTVIEEELATAQETGEAGLAHAWQRIRNGLLAQFLAEEELVGAALESLKADRDLDRRAAVIRILEDKRRYGLGHHRAHTLGDRRIDDWLAPTGDLEGLLDALTSSDLVDPEAPLQSPFLRLLAPQGPMHRVFREDEIAILVQWIESLKEPAEGSRRGSIPLPAEPPGEFCALPAACSRDGSPPAVRDPRRLFHRLLNPERYLDEQAAARFYVQRCLRKTHRALHSPLVRADLRGFPYRVETLRARIDAIHDRAVAAYRPFVPPPRLSREEYRWLLIRLAPLVLVDGAWLQKAAWLEGSHAQVAARLRAIYLDEIGGGDPEQNHANIFRRLLDGEGIRLPEVTSAEFIARPEFSAPLFVLPAYLLAISRFPHAFLPEILGLNLAIELSGLGAFYMTAVDEMSYLGLDPAVVRVHLASDNLASGHAALARDAVEIDLERVDADLGPEERERHWRRVWAGYASLSIVPRRTWAVLFTRFLLRFGWDRLTKLTRGFRG